MIPKEISYLSDDEIELRLFSLFWDKKCFDYDIVRKKDNMIIGYCGINLNNDIEYEYLGNIEYEVFEQYRGNNYAYKATKLLGQVALYFGVDNLNISVRPDNLASVKTIRKLGARFICFRKLLSNVKLYDNKPEFQVYNWKIEGDKQNDRY